MTITWAIVHNLKVNALTATMERRTVFVRIKTIARLLINSWHVLYFFLGVVRLETLVLIDTKNQNLQLLLHKSKKNQKKTQCYPLLLRWMTRLHRAVALVALRKSNLRSQRCSWNNEQCKSSAVVCSNCTEICRFSHLITRKPRWKSNNVSRACN